MSEMKEKFFDIVMARSNENQRALDLLLSSNCHALVGAIIRMELDSLIRVHHFNNADEKTKEILLNNFFNEGEWKFNGKRIYDSVMLKNMPPLLGWAEHIYAFCCAFIHLSPYHDWASDSNIPNLTDATRQFIVTEIRAQQNDVWGYDTSLAIEEDFGFDDLIPFAPHIFKKLRENLYCEMKRIP